MQVEGDTSVLASIKYDGLVWKCVTEADITGEKKWSSIDILEYKSICYEITIYSQIFSKQDSSMKVVDDTNVLASIKYDRLVGIGVNNIGV